MGPNHYVIEWQRALGLLPTGFFDEETLNASMALLETSRTIPVPVEHHDSKPATIRPGHHEPDSEP